MRKRHRRVKYRDTRTPLAECVADRLSQEEASARAQIQYLEHDASLMLRLFLREQVHDQQVLRSQEAWERTHIETVAFLALCAIRKKLFYFRLKQIVLLSPHSPKIELSKAQQVGIVDRARSAHFMRMQHKATCSATMRDRTRLGSLRDEIERLRVETRDVLSP